MSEASVFWFVAGAVLGLAIGVICMYLDRFGRERLRKLEVSSEIEPVSRGKAVIARVDAETKTVYLTAQPPPNDFAVNGPPRRKPWVVRKRELEEAARTKRKKIESFSEYV
jgi:hypothetical protein